MLDLFSISLDVFLDGTAPLIIRWLYVSPSAVVAEIPMQCGVNSMEGEAVQKKTSSSHHVSFLFICFKRKSSVQLNREEKHFS